MSLFDHVTERHLCGALSVFVGRYHRKASVLWIAVDMNEADL